MTKHKRQDDDGDLESLEIWRTGDDDRHLESLYKDRELMKKALSLPTILPKTKSSVTKKLKIMTEEIEVMEKTKALYELGIL